MVRHFMLLGGLGCTVGTLSPPVHGSGWVWGVGGLEPTPAPSAPWLGEGGEVVCLAFLCGMGFLVLGVDESGGEKLRFWRFLRGEYLLGDPMVEFELSKSVELKLGREHLILQQCQEQSEPARARKTWLFIPRHFL